ncbi:MAG: sensor histidine kinase [Planctomycetota bacterium]
MSQASNKPETVVKTAALGGGEERVLILAPAGHEASTILRVLSEAGLDAMCCGDIDQLCEEIQGGAAAALVDEETLSAEARRRITATLSPQPNWSDFPLLVITSSVRQGDTGWQALWGIEGTAHLALLDRPLHTATLVSTVRTAVESRRRQYQIRDELAARQRVEDSLRKLNETLEQQIAERTAVAERRAQDLRRMAAELSEAERRERKRLAGLLHDDLQQLLLAVKLRLPVLVEADPKQIGHHINRLDELVGECLSTTRNLAHELSPPILQHGTLPEIIEWLGTWFWEKHRLVVTVEPTSDLPPLSDPLRVFLFDAVRELLTNAVKHSGSMEVRITLWSESPQLTVQVEDEGASFDPPAVEARLQQPQGFGLFNIRERLEAFQGRLEIRNTRRGGACFRLVVPVTREVAGETE